MKSRLICAAAALAFALPAAAEPGNNFIDGYYLSSTFEAPEPAPVDDEIEGDGAGIKGAIELLPDLYLVGEYQNLEFDESFGSDSELNQARIGVGFGPGVGNGGGLYGRAQYLTLDDDDGSEEDEQSGFAGHVGFGLPLSDMLRLYGEVGYLSLDDLDGPEFLGGVDLRLGRNFGLFADYRVTELEYDSGEEVSLEDVRVGARFYF